MKKLFLALFILLSVTCFWANAQQTEKTIKKVIINHFFSCPLDAMLDTLQLQYHIPIVFERDSMHKMDVVDHFFEEPLINVLKKVCRDNDLHYWIENDGTVYMLQKPDDLPRLKRLYAFLQKTREFQPKRLEPAKGPPTQYKFSITGKVFDQQTGEALPSANVQIRGTDISARTNTSGVFTILEVPSDTCVADISLVGYQRDAFRLSTLNLSEPLQFGLFPSFNALNVVDITDKKNGVLNTDSKKVSVLQLTPTALDKLPNIGERDIMRAFQLMPGVSGTNESSSGAYVRGGTPDQNLVLFDGFTVYEVDHLYGFFSAFNSNIVRDVELYKGGFSAKYGGRLSSVTEIRGKDGNSKETNVGGDISLLSVNAFVETPVGDKSSAIVAYRHSYQGPLYDKIFGQFNTSTTGNGPGGGGPGGPGGRGPGGGGFGGFQQTTPSSYFYDLNARYTYRASNRQTFSWSYYNGADNTDNSRTLPAFGASSSSLQLNDKYVTNNTGTSLKATSSWSSKLFSVNALTYSSFTSDRNRGTIGSIVDSGITKSLNNGTLESNRLRDLGFKSDWEWQAKSNYKLLFGAYGSSLSVNYQDIQNDTLALISDQQKAFNGGLYTELSLDPIPDLHVQPGLRETYYSPTGRLYTEPRLSFTYKLTDRVLLKGATGRFYQFANQVTREDILEGNRNFWLLSNNGNIPVGVADHYIAGFNYETDAFLLDVEGYYKRLDGLTQYTITQEGIGPMRIPAASASNSLQQNFYNGSGFTRGVELLLQKKQGLYTGWIAYTLGQAQNKFAAIGPDYYPSDQDVRHELKLINMYHYQRWSFAATFIFSTGHPYTAPLSAYAVTTLDGGKITYLAISGKNTERLPDYHRLDLSATYDLLRVDGKKIGSLGFSLFNAYDHINTWYKDYTVRNNQVITTNVNYLGITPNITLSLKLK
ncbi:hypothetical protein BEL04_18850 [Mucilaginibacter sp. PPCGB 2223]|uniref:TonB-dependent receptor n=1 Tax=Mucilaginibacter sp. PPCGB 2223 TaxID=1886027 RepID=UPI000825E2C4|nr:carboxypeptidase-like regulatory domain-containing protein [Mucilaginibacter sp. PPCGB 2223]OCX50791.1 hypothetical protein BEL04_18850 [Mucilaginibacter sp. PPCGB 2223]